MHPLKPGSKGPAPSWNQCTGSISKWKHRNKETCPTRIEGTGSAPPNGDRLKAGTRKQDTRSNRNAGSKAPGHIIEIWKTTTPPIRKQDTG